MSLTFPAIAMAPDGTRAIRLDSFEGQREMFDRDSLAVAFGALMAPGERSSRLSVHLDRLINERVATYGFKTLSKLNSTDAIQVIAVAAIARHLMSLTPGAELGLHSLDCWDECLIALAETRRAADEQILRYVKAKLYWSWRYDLTSVSIDWPDMLLLGCAYETIDRVSLIALNEYLSREQFPNGVVIFRPLPKLLKEFSAETSQQSVSAGVKGDVLQRLAVPRYTGPRRHMEKALNFFSADPPDNENTAKESVLAVEALARIVCADPKATLGDLIQRLKGSGRLNPGLAKLSWFSLKWSVGVVELGSRVEGVG